MSRTPSPRTCRTIPSRRDPVGSHSQTPLPQLRQLLEASGCNILRGRVQSCPSGALHEASQYMILSLLFPNCRRLADFYYCVYFTSSFDGRIFFAQLEAAHLPLLKSREKHKENL